MQIYLEHSNNLRDTLGVTVTMQLGMNTQCLRLKLMILSFNSGPK